MYALNTLKSLPQRHQFYGELQERLHTILQKEKIIMLRDFNATIGTDTIPCITQRYNEEVMKLYEYFVTQTY